MIVRSATCMDFSLPAPDVNPSDVQATGTDRNNLVISWKVGYGSSYSLSVEVSLSIMVDSPVGV